MGFIAYVPIGHTRDPTSAGSDWLALDRLFSVTLARESEAMLAKYVSGTNGLIFKNLNKANVCPNSVSLYVVMPILTMK